MGCKHSFWVVGGVEWVRAVCARLGGKACYVRPCGVRQARWNICGCGWGSTDVLADERKNN